MKAPLFIAKRYVFSKGRFQAVALISTFAAFVVGVAVCAFFVVLSVFSGLKDFGLSFSSSLDPDIKITPTSGAYLSFNDSLLQNIRSIKGVEEVSPVIEQRVLLEHQKKYATATILGIDSSLESVIRLESSLVLGRMHKPLSNEVLLGYGIAHQLGIGWFDFGGLIHIIVPKTSSSNIINPSPFQKTASMAVGLYQISEDLDHTYLFGNLAFVRSLLDVPKNNISSLYIKCKPYSEGLLRQLLPSEFQVMNRKDMNVALYRMLETENMAIYMILTLVLVIAMFNIIGAIVMMVLDKRKDLSTLVHMGATIKQVRQIFFMQGALLSLWGGLIGLSVGVILVLSQQWYPWIYIPGTSIVYPVVFTTKNFFAVILTFSFLTFCASLLASSAVYRALAR